MNWISVSDKLPNPMETKLFWVPFHRNTTTGYYNGESFVRHNENAIGEITHWMELPSPPTADTSINDNLTINEKP